MVLQHSVRSLHSVCAPSEHRFRNFCYYRNSLPYCYHSGCLQDIYCFKTAQKRNSSTKTTSCAKWQHVKHCEDHKVCSMYNYHLSRILGCYLPYIIIMITEMCLSNTIMEALFMCSETIRFLNSSLNPIIYCWKMRHVRNVVKGILRSIFRSYNGLDGRITVNKTF